MVAATLGRVKRRRWPLVLQLVITLLVVLYGVGASSAYGEDTGNSLPFAVASIVGTAIAIGVITRVIRRWQLPTALPVALRGPDGGGTQFAVFPFAPFVSGLAAARWQLGDSSPLPKFKPTARPVVVTDDGGITVWADATDATPLARIPASWVQTVSLREVPIQISRVPVKDRVACLVVELLARRTPVTLTLPPCDPANQTGRPSPAKLLDWTRQMNSALTSRERN
jgi:hypothetical protein